MSSLAPFRLQPQFVRRTWGRCSLVPWYPNTTEQGEEPVGEVWLTGPACVVNDGAYASKTLADVAAAEPEALLGGHAEQAEFPLLLKLLFPDAKLSVQVHPDDDAAQAAGMPRGKTECWYVLAAEPGATVACGLLPGTTPDHVRAAIGDGTLEQRLQHLPVSKGDMIFVDAGTVHAIGPGVTLLEVQQTSDTTYRLFDYGRPRELHVEQGLAVTRTETRAGKVAPQPLPNGTRLIDEQYFTVDSFPMGPGDMLLLNDAAGRPHCVVALHGDAMVVVDGIDVPMPEGTCVVIPASAGEVRVKATHRLELVRAAVPA